MKDPKILWKNISEKRFFRRLRSKVKQRLRNGSPVDKATLRRFHISKSTKFRSKDKKHLKRSKFWEVVKIPIVLSYLSDHKSTFEFFKSLENKLKTKKPKNLHIDHAETTEIGLSASHFFDRLIENYQKKWNAKGFFIQMKGITSGNKEINNFLLSFGLLSDKKTTDPVAPGFVDSGYKTKFEIFKFNGSNAKANNKGDAASGLARYFKKCFYHKNHELNQEGESFLADVFGEIIGNAEEHSSDQNQNTVCWSVLGCYNKDTSYCKFAIINSGLTIYQGLSNPNSASSTAINSVAKIIKKNKSFFDKNSEETIWNVMAIQDGISSKRTLSGQASTRGQGLMGRNRIHRKT